MQPEGCTYFGAMTASKRGYLMNKKITVAGLDCCMGDFVIDLIRRQVSIKNERVDLSNQEFELQILFVSAIFVRLWLTNVHNLP